MRARVLVGLVALALATPARADSDPAAAKVHFDLGSQLYQQGRYDEALAELTRGYELDARPEFLYSLGQTERKRGRCKQALDYYQRYLDSGLPRERAAAVLIQMDRCRAELDHPPILVQPAPPPVVVAPPPAAAAVIVAPPPAPPKRTPIYKRWWLWTTVAVVAAVGVGVGLGVGLTANRGSDFKPTLPDLVIR
ncbi:MAG TPA: tetratricopeptide repeat protein [Polyangia bacterium]|nr:tetratricopeptide repeat protein [Polyangia bacterium]